MKKNLKVKIYIVAHKNVDFPKNEIYFPLQVGAYNKEKFTEITDDTKKNISQKNSSFCELTAAYWILKNDCSDIVGITHYRRFFFRKPSTKFSDILDKSDILQILNDYDIIVPKKTYLLKYKNIKTAYCSLHKEKDWNLCKKIVEEKYPEYLEAFEKVEKDKSFYACNMFICSKKMFNCYYDWLFDILFDLESKIDIKSYDKYNQRIFGFLSERLFNVWLYKNKLNVKEMPVYNIDKNLFLQELDFFCKKIIVKK